MAPDHVAPDRGVAAEAGDRVRDKDTAKVKVKDTAKVKDRAAKDAAARVRAGKDVAAQVKVREGKVREGKDVVVRGKGRAAPGNRIRCRRRLDFQGWDSPGAVQDRIATSVRPGLAARLATRQVTRQACRDAGHAANSQSIWQAGSGGSCEFRSPPLIDACRRMPRRAFFIAMPSRIAYNYAVNKKAAPQDRRWKVTGRSAAGDLSNKNRRWACAHFFFVEPFLMLSQV